MSWAVGSHNIVCLFFEMSVWEDLGAFALLTQYLGFPSVQLGYLCG